MERGTVISVVLTFLVDGERERERERERGCDERLQSQKTEKETAVSIVGLCVVFSFSKSLG